MLCLCVQVFLTQPERKGLIEIISLLKLMCFNVLDAGADHILVNIAPNLISIVSFAYAFNNLRGSTVIIRNVMSSILSVFQIVVSKPSQHSQFITVIRQPHCRSARSSNKASAVVFRSVMSA